jgi:hypothetical protein
MLVIKPFGFVLALLAAQAVSAATNNCTSWSDRFQTDLEGVCTIVMEAKRGGNVYKLKTVGD